MSKPKSIEEWGHIIETARSSGLSDKDWCLANGVSINTFYYNVRRLRHNACVVPKTTGRYVSPSQAVVPVEILDDTGTDSIAGNEPATAICINCNGMNIHISNMASPALIKTVLQTVGGCSC
jgi:hypothetical protein